MGKARIAVMGVLLSAALLVLSCASLRMTDEWRDNSFQGPAYRNIMVVALTKRADLRQPVEDEFRRQLRARGIEAAACYECIPDVDKINREELAKVGPGMGIEAFLIVRVLRTDTRIESYGSSGAPASSSVGRDSMMDMHWGAPDPPLTRRSESATLESRLFDAKTAALVWRATAESVNPTGDGSGIARFVRAVLVSLDGEKLIPPARP
ncbi:MAG: hypothetical protein A4E67_00883 [Syntrophaceae bacterium PtaB.Bin038]|jgi:hypothetical protein|nr:MAG: hypothetical protein A4E67_00883 [Syntrophaceae bacterium PtaB.Bin038]